METLILLGTGNATVTKCYNTCFAIQREEEYFLVDTGGGNGILAQLEKANIPINKIHEIFISHEHTDHLFGIIWLIRMIATKIRKQDYEGKLTIYCHKELEEIILTICQLTVQKKFYEEIGKSIIFQKVNHDEVIEVFGNQTTFFDIGSTKAKQFGFSMKLKSDKIFTFLGDEPYYDSEEKYAKNADWLLHEAFCLYSDRDKFQPYEKHHATVKDACESAQKLGVKNLVLYHTEDKNINERKRLYTEEGKAFFTGMLYVPNDLERIEL